MSKVRHCVVYSLEDRYFALPLSTVERIARAAAITPLPSAMDMILGVINLQGRVLPVIDIRKRFSLPHHDINADHHFIVGKSGDRPVAILVDNVMDIIEVADEDMVKNDDILSDLPFISGVIKKDNEMIMVQDLETLLSSDELQVVDDVINSLKKSEKKTNKTKSPTPKKK